MRSPCVQPGLHRPLDKDRQDFTIYCGGLAMGIFGRVPSVSGGSEPLHELIQPVAVVRRKNHTAIEDCAAAPFAHRAAPGIYTAPPFLPPSERATRLPACGQADKGP